MLEYETSMVFYDDNMTEILPVLLPNGRQLVLITHDESTFYCNEGKKLFWMENGKKKLLPKSKGTSIMISGFICPCHGFMSAEIDGTTLKSFLMFQAGTQREGWFTNRDLVNQIKYCVPLFNHLHPNCDILLAFDNSTTHRAKAPDGVDATCINLGDGGKNCTALMRNGWYINAHGIKVIQAMHYEDGKEKGIKQILIERDLFKDSEGNNLKLECKDGKDKVPRNERKVITEKRCARYVLSQQPDFLEQEPWLVEVCKNANMSIIFYPKYHCDYLGICEGIS
jgi:hypothetical protein